MRMDARTANARLCSMPLKGRCLRSVATDFPGWNVMLANRSWAIDFQHEIVSFAKACLKINSVLIQHKSYMH